MSLTIEEFKRSVAVVIGIDNYTNGISRLRNAVNDARTVGAVLENEHGYEVILRLDDEAKYEDLKHLLTIELPAKIGSDDRLLVYFAGHGVATDSDDGPAGYLLPQDAKPKGEEKFLHMGDLQKWLSALSCRHLLLILDCCFAGAFRWSSSRHVNLIPEIIHEERYAYFIKDPAWQVITSSAYDQKADDGRKNSPFALALIDGLKGAADIFPGPPKRDGVITATELYLYLRQCVEGVPNNGSVTEFRQTPGLWQFKKHDKGEFIFLTPGHELNLPPAPVLTEENNPYRGLNSYDEEHRELFFGRTRVVSALVEKVSAGSLTVVVGASGTGKSSVVKAGLLPCLRESSKRHWEILPILRPGKSPLHSLTILSGYLIESSPENDSQLQMGFVDAVRAWCEINPQTNLLLVVDQLEELFTMCRSQAEREEFLLLLSEIIEINPEQVRIVLTIRSDFEPQFLSSALKSNWSESRFIVPAMTQDELREAIEGPASARVLYFEPSDLINRLINEVIQMPGALSLLSFTLSEMYIKYLNRRSDNRALTEADYLALGGVIGSLRRRAREEYESLESEALKQTMRRVMLRMLALEGGEIARRRVLIQELDYSNAEENERVVNIINQLVVARLLIKDRDADDVVYVEPAHDALVRGWDMLLQWVHEEQREQDNLLLQRRVTQAAMDWKKGRGQFWDDDPRLPQLKNILKNNKYWLNGLESEFVLGSVREGKKNRFIRNFLVGSALALLVIGSIVSVTFGLRANAAEQQAIKDRDIAKQEKERADFEAENAKKQANIADEQRRTAESQTKIAKEQREKADQQTEIAKQERQKAEESTAEAVKQKGIAVEKAAEARKQQGIAVAKAAESKKRLIDFYEEQGRRDSLGGNPDRAMLYLNEAYKEGDRSLPMQYMMANVSRNFDGQLSALVGHQRPVTATQFSADGQRVVTVSEDGNAIVWNVKPGKEASILSAKEGVVSSAQISPNGKKVVTFNSIYKIEINENSPNDPIVYNSEIILWNADNGEQIYSQYGNGDETFDFSRDSKYFFLANEYGATVYKAVKDGDPLKLNGHENNTELKIAFDDKSSRVISATSDRVIVRNFKKKQIEFVPEPDDEIVSVFFSSDEPRLITRDTNNNEIKLRDGQTGALINVISPVSDQILTVKVSDDGQRIATQGMVPMQESTEVKIWNARDGSPVSSNTIPVEEQKVKQYSSNLSRLLSIEKNAVTIWDVVSGRQFAHRAFKEDLDLFNPALSPDGEKFLTFEAGSNVGKVWKSGKSETSSTLPLKVDIPPDAEAVSSDFSSDGSLIVTKYQYSGTSDSEIRLKKFNLALLDYQNYKPVLIPVASHPEEFLGISPDGRQILASGNGKLYIRERSIASKIIILGDYRGAPVNFSFSPDSRSLAVKYEFEDLKIWDIVSGTFRSLPTKAENVDTSSLELTRFEFSPNGERLIYATCLDYDNGSAMYVSIWDTRTLRRLKPESKSKSEAEDKEVITYKGNEKITFPVISPDNSFLVLPNPADKLNQPKGTAQVWDISKPRPQFLFPLIGHSAEINSIVFSPDSKRIVTAGDDQTAIIWNSATGGIIASLNAIKDKTSKRVFSANFDPSGNFIVTTGENSPVKIWSAETGELITELKDSTGNEVFAAFSPDGSLRVFARYEIRNAAYKSENRVKIWRSPFEGDRKPKDLIDMVERVLPYPFYNGRPLLMRRQE